MKFSIVQGQNAGRAKIISTTSIENFYPELTPDGKHISALIHTPGYWSIGNAYPTGSNRGLYTTSTGRMFIIISNKLIEMDSGELFTERGTIATSSGQCYMTDNGTQLMITDGSNGYIYTLASNILSTISDVDFPATPTVCLFSKGYFIVVESGTGKFWWSDSYDGTSWQSLNFATAEYSQDNLVSIVKTSSGILWMIGELSTELWQSTGNASLPWARISGATKEVGTVAIDSVASNGSYIAWLGNNSLGYGAVYMGTEYEMSRISTPAIEYTIKNLSSDISLAYSFMYSDETHDFYVLSFSTEKTLVYDFTTEKWHTRGTLNTGTGFNERQFAKGYTFFNNRHYVGHYQDQYIMRMSLEYLHEIGNEIKRVITTDSISYENKLLKHRRLELDMEKGIGTVTITDPQITAQFSNDGGHTYSSEAWATAGKTPGSIGEYTQRVFWGRLGSARDRRYRITMSAAVKWIISGCFIDVE